MEEIKIFKNDEFGEMRTVTIDNEPWFIGKDIADILGYSNTRDALQRHIDIEDKSEVAIHDGRQNRNMTIINESGFYSLVLSSKLPSAKQFKRWVTSEVLPMIRKTGGYINNDDLFLNTYLPNADEATKLLFKAQLQVVRSLNNKIEKLEEEKEILLTESLTIEDSRILINAMIRKIASSKFHGNFSACWKSFYVQLNYKLGISIKGRNKEPKKPLLDTLTKEEMIEAEKVVRAWAVNLGLDLNDILNLKSMN